MSNDNNYPKEAYVQKHKLSGEDDVWFTFTDKLKEIEDGEMAIYELKEIKNKKSEITLE